jgi:type II secretory pathway pseudopilin PulG
MNIPSQRNIVSRHPCQLRPIRGIGLRNESGVALIEVIMAVAFFGMAALGLLRALTAMSQAANNAKMELRMTAVLESTLTQFARQPKIEETAKAIISDPDESGVWTETRITEMNEKNGNLLQTDESEQGGRQQLQQMYHIVVTAFWELGGQRGEETAETYRYGPLFQQTGAQQ